MILTSPHNYTVITMLILQVSESKFSIMKCPGRRSFICCKLAHFNINVAALSEPVSPKKETSENFDPTIQYFQKGRRQVSNTFTRSVLLWRLNLCLNTTSSPLPSENDWWPSKSHSSMVLFLTLIYSYALTLVSDNAIKESFYDSIIQTTPILDKLIVSGD